MKRVGIQKRPDWKNLVEQVGLLWHTAPDGNPYWDESAYYAFSQNEIDRIGSASKELYQLFLEAGQYVIDHNLFDRFGIPPWVVPFIKRAWDVEPPALNHGRFDLGYDGVSPPKLFEYNCDTPTSLFEAAVVQWNWKEEVLPDMGQFNSIHEWLIWKWQDIKPFLKGPLVHFTNTDDPAGEDTLTVTYLRDTALKAGIESEAIFTSRLRWNKNKKRLLDTLDRPIDTLFHLYPWECLVNERGALRIAESYDQTIWIEPIWKMLWSNKAILAILWKLFPDHPNLLPAYFEPRGDTYVKKPILGREGANVTIVRGGQEIASSNGTYGREGYIYQGMYALPDFDRNFPIIGSWMVDGNPAGIGIREGGLITGNTARFIPHIIENI